jgi:hypothetical protein
MSWTWLFGFGLGFFGSRAVIQALEEEKNEAIICAVVAACCLIGIVILL